MADIVNALDRCCANVGHAERDIFQPGPRPGGLVLYAGGLPHHPPTPSLFPSKCPPSFAQFQVLPTQVLAFVFLTCRAQQSQHASTSPSSPLLLTRVCPPSIPTLLASGPTFSAAAVHQLWTVAAGNDFALLGCVTASR